MPSPQRKHRTYCKTCNDFTIHNLEYVCETCYTAFTSYFPSEVDKDLILQQRSRYTEMKRREFNNILNIYRRPLDSIFSETRVGYDVIECDAGQLRIDENKKKQREEAKRIGQEMLDDYNTNYKKLNRNDKCNCGSGKKFKQCHLLYFNQYLKL